MAANANPANACGNGTSVNQGSALPFPPPNPVLGSVRQPYVMTPTSTSVIIRWRSATPTPSVVSYGVSMASLSQTFSADATGVTEHTAKLTSLVPGTTYYYAAGSVAATAGTPGLFFKTAPAAGVAASSTRFWLMGDFGTSANGVPNATVVNIDSYRELNVLNSWLAYEAATNRMADMFLMLGDNAYNTVRGRNSIISWPGLSRVKSCALTERAARSMRSSSSQIYVLGHGHCSSPRVFVLERVRSLAVLSRAVR